MAVGADSRRGALHTWSALLTLALLPVAFLWPSLFGAGVFLPYDPARFPPAATLLSAEERAALEAQRANFDVLELPIVVVPELQLSQQQLGLGAMPAWNPYARFGGPLFASGLTGLAYPPTWQLLARDDPREGLALHAWFGFVVAGWLCFWLLRALRVKQAMPSMR